MLSVVMLSVFLLSVVMLNVFMLSVVMMNVFMLSVVAPLKCQHPLHITLPSFLQLVLIAKTFESSSNDTQHNDI